MELRNLENLLKRWCDRQPPALSQMILTSWYSYLCVISLIQGLICVKKKLWQRWWYLTSEIRSWRYCGSCLDLSSCCCWRSQLLQRTNSPGEKLRTPAKGQHQVTQPWKQIFHLQASLRWLQPHEPSRAGTLKPDTPEFLTGRNCEREYMLIAVLNYRILEWCIMQLMWLGLTLVKWMEEKDFRRDIIGGKRHKDKKIRSRKMIESGVDGDSRRSVKWQKRRQCLMEGLKHQGNQLGLYSVYKREYCRFGGLSYHLRKSSV